MKYLIGLIVYTLILNWLLHNYIGFAALMLAVTFAYAFNES